MYLKPKPLGLTKRFAVWLLILLFSCQPVLAATQVEADPAATAGKQPQVSNAPNGVTMVQIAAPNGAGVSHNLYRNFQVGPDGLILNNSYVIVNTQLAGYIPGNPNLSAGSARVILNEVTGSLPSQLKGYIEIAGQKADLVLANPNGIVGNGFGFINANRAVLTTGTPIFGGSGSLDAFRVTGGQIAIEGNGLNASNIDRVDLISRAISVNAGIWANQLNMVTGANQVDYTTLNAQRGSGDANVPQVALDVASLGGMYANKIILVGTEAGVGVNYQGILSATGDVNITNEGKVILANQTKAGGNLTITARDDVTNQGTVYAQGNANVNTTGTLTNTGTLASAQDTTIAAQNISSTGTLGAGIQSDGSIGASGNLTITAVGGTNATGLNLAGGNLAITGADINQNGATTVAGGSATVTATHGDVNNTGALLTANGELIINATGAVKNDTSANGTAGQIIAGKVSITANDVSNKGGSILQTGSDTANIMASNSMDNTGGQIATNGKLQLRAGSISNANSTMSAQSDITLNVNGDFANQGTLQSNSTLAINAANITNAASGTMNADKINITANGDLNNDGQITGNQIAITSQNMTNNNTVMGGTVTVNASNLTNQGQSGLIAATDSVNLWVSNTLTNQNGANIVSLGDINIAANNQKDDSGQLINRTQQVTNSAAAIEAANNMNIAAEQVSNQSGPLDIGVTTSTSTKVWTMAPHIQYSVIFYDSDAPYVGQKQFGGPGQANSLNGLYCKLTVTVPKENVISYDNSQKKIVFNDITNTLMVFGTDDTYISGYTTYNTYYLTPQQVQGFFSTPLIGYDDYGNAYTYYHDPAKYTVLPAYQGTTNWGSGTGYIAAPTWAGKEPGKTTAYCQSVDINAAGDYVISFYPGYDPNVNLSPENQRTMPTYHSDASAEERRTTTTTTQTEYIASAPVIGKINVGKNLNINIGQQFANKYSQVAVGNAVTGNIGNFQNIGYNLKQTSTWTDVSYFHDYFHTGGDGHIESSDGWGTFGPYYSTIDIGVGVPANFTAKTITVTGTSVSNIEQRPDGTTGPQVGRTIDPSQPASAPVAAPNQQNIDLNSGSGGSPMTTITQNGLYTVHPEQTSQYLIETNSRFTNYNNFISSNYMLNLLNLDPALVQKRMGDGFYEQKLVNEQINQLTGRQYLAGYDNTDTEFKALMDNGVAAAKTFNLVPGIALTADQIAKLSTDLVWMVEQEVTLPSGEKQKALVPVVYLAPAGTMKLTPGGALIAADKVDMNITGNVLNSGTIAGESSVSIQGNTLTNENNGQITSNGSTTLTAVNDIINRSGVISGKQVLVEAGRDVLNETATTQISASTRDNSTGHTWTGTNTIVGPQAGIQSQNDLTVKAGRDITVRGATIAANGDAAVNAGRNLTVGTVAAVNNGKDTADRQNYSHSDTTNVASAVQGTNVTLTSQGDTILTGTQVTAGKDLTVAEGNLAVNTAKDIHSETKRNDGTYARSTYDESTIGSNLQAGNDVKISAVPSDDVPGTVANKGKITVEGSNITSQDGSVSITANHGITVQEVTEEHESLTETRNTKSGFLSSTTTYTRDYSLINEVKGSTISGDKVDITSGADLTVKGSNVVGTNDVTLKAAGDVNLASAKETGKNEHYREEKTSGIFGGGGIGFTIGSKSEKTTLNEQTIDEIGSTVGSINGNVNITAGNKVSSAGTTIVSGQDTNITGKDITIDNTVNTYDSQYKYEFKQSGLTVSLGGGAIDAATNVAGDVRRSGEVEDGRLKALYDYKAVKDLQKMKDFKGNLQVGVSVSLGSTTMTSEQNTHVETVNASNVTAGGDVNIKATEGDINLKGTNINATDVNLDASKNINIAAAQNKEQTNSQTTSSSRAVGGTIGTSFFANASNGNGKENENATTNTGSVINARDTLKINSGNDTNIIGSQVKGDKVEADIKGNLNIASVQDTDNYTAKDQNSGFGVSTGPKGGVNGSIGTGKTDSTYASVTEQAGIYAGQGGFDINVGRNTDLKGAVIASTATPDKNTLSTDTLTYSDIQNKADYSASSIGANYDSKKYSPDDPNYKNQGLTPNIGVTATGNADSTTKSAISAGTIEVRSGNTDLTNLNRNTTDSLNALGKIFDKKTVQEQQELAQVFGEEAFKAIGDLGLKAGSPEKAAVTAAVGGIMAQLGGSSFASGAAGAGFTEIAMNEIAKIKDPAVQQWVAYIVGKAAASAVGGNGQTGGSTSISKIRNNDLDPAHILQNPIIVSALFLAGYIVDSQNRIVNKAGEVIATWNAEIGSWVDSTGTAIGNGIQDLYVWAKSDGKLKRMPKNKIDELGGESWTSQVKEKTGKSKSDLYWDPKTGDVYSVPKGGGPPEWVDTVEP